MMENNKYFEELSRILSKHDIENGPVENGRLIIRMDGQPVGRIESGPIRCLAPGDLRTEEASEAFHKAVPYAELVAEYMDGLKRAPLLKADGLDDGFRLLADFNGTVLAGKEMDGGYGMQFVTWDWSYDRSSVEQGHYYHDNYEGAKADFSERSGLVQKGRQFTDKQLIAIFQSVDAYIEADNFWTDEERQLLSDLQEQIKEAIPDVRERIHANDNEQIQALQQHQL